MRKQQRKSLTARTTRARPKSKPEAPKQLLFKDDKGQQLTLELDAYGAVACGILVRSDVAPVKLAGDVASQVAESLGVHYLTSLVQVENSSALLTSTRVLSLNPLQHHALHYIG